MSTNDQEWADWQTPPTVPDSEDLELLVTDAAARAEAMLTGGSAGPAPAGEAAAPGAAADPLLDAVRLLATPTGTARVAAAARLTGMAEDELRRLVLAYRHGGAGGVAASVGASPCGDGEMAAAVAQVRAQRALPLGDLVMTLGAITDHGAGLRVRLGPDGRWYPFTHARGEWWPAAGAAPSAGAAYQAARRARSLRRA